MYIYHLQAHIILCVSLKSLQTPMNDETCRKHVGWPTTHGKAPQMNEMCCDSQ